MALKPGIPVVASSSDVNGSGYGKNECQRTDLTILYVCPATRSLNGRRKVSQSVLCRVKNAVCGTEYTKYPLVGQDEGGSPCT